MLFELMVPNELKSSLAQVDNLVLVVDAETAAYPWELMSAGDKPLCVAKGLCGSCRPRTTAPRSGSGGNGRLCRRRSDCQAAVRQLPGAADEAKAVYEILRKGFEVDNPFRNHRRWSYSRVCTRSLTA